MLKRLSLAASLLIALGQAPAHAASLAGRADVDAYIDQISRQHGLNRDEVRATLLAAQREPAKHRDLIVRVAGYSDYFINLTPELQDEIIRRTEQPAF